MTTTPTFQELFTLHCDGETTVSQEIDICRLISGDARSDERLRRQKCLHEHFRRSLNRCYGHLRAPCALVAQVQVMFSAYRQVDVPRLHVMTQTIGTRLTRLLR